MSLYLDSSLQLDALLPAQWREQNQGDRSRAPEWWLLFAVLEDAVRCFSEGLRRSGHDPRRFRAACEWLFTDRSDAPLRVEAVCGHLGLDLEYLRRGLRRWQELASRDEFVLPGRIRPSGDHMSRRIVLREDRRRTG